MHRTRLPGMLLALAVAATPFAGAREASSLAADPALEARVLRVADELRCLVCQNETIAASQADLAVDLRSQIRLQLSQGRSEGQIIDFMVKRYGEFVRYRPAFSATTAALWIGPFVLLAGAAGMLAATVRRRRRTTATAPLSDSESRQVRRLLGQADGPA